MFKFWYGKNAHASVDSDAIDGRNSDDGLQ
jgi:hypothetical protein